MSDFHSSSLFGGMGEITCGARRLLLAALVSLLGLQLALQLPRVLAESADAAVRFGEPSAGRGTYLKIKYRIK